MLGVVEADCLEPTHNKQAFNTTDIAYQKCQKHLEKSMNDYYFGCRTCASRGSARAASGERSRRKAEPARNARTRKAKAKA